MTEAEASKAALDTVPGTVDQIELDDEDGFVIWEVEVRGADGVLTEFAIDAGDANILEQEVDDDGSQVEVEVVVDAGDASILEQDTETADGDKG